MSVQTEADNRLEDAANLIFEARKELVRLFVDEPYGYDEFNQHARDNISAAFYALDEIAKLDTFQRYRQRTGRGVRITTD